MAASLGLFWLGFRGCELALTAAISYYAMGLLYEWTHYIVHTRYGALWLGGGRCPQSRRHSTGARHTAQQLWRSSRSHQSRADGPRCV